MMYRWSSFCRKSKRTIKDNLYWKKCISQKNKSHLKHAILLSREWLLCYSTANVSTEKMLKCVCRVVGGWFEWKAPYPDVQWFRIFFCQEIHPEMLSKAMKMTSAHLLSGVKSISFLARENHYFALKLTKWQCNANQELIMFVCLYSLRKEL